MSETTYLITGANRGIGRGLVEHYLSKESNTVIAAVRDPTHPTSQALSALPRGPHSKLITVQIVSDSLSADDTSSTAARAASELRNAHRITRIDVVIANAAILTALNTISDIQPEDMLSHYSVNVVAVTQLFRAMKPFLLQSRKKEGPKFAPIGSAAGSLDFLTKNYLPNGLYGPTKAALNYVMVLLHHEEPEICSFCIDPGWTQTDMGNKAARLIGAPGGIAQVTIEDCIAGVTDVVDNATRENTSGTFRSFKGDIMPW